MKIVISAGHGGNDSGAVANGFIEKVLNLKVALYVKEYLLKNGFEVKLIREDDTYVSLADRVKQANTYNADYYIDIHHNAGGGDGAEVIHSIHYGKGTELAICIAKEFEKTGQNIRRIFSRKTSAGTGDYYYVIRNTKMTAVICEYAFLDNPADAQAIDTDEELMTQAKAIVKGLCNYLGKDFVTHGVKPSAVSNDLIKGIQALTESKVINSPEYWLENAVKGKQVDGEYVGVLISRLGKIL